MLHAPKVIHRVVVSQIRLSLTLSHHSHERLTVTIERGVPMPKSVTSPEGIDWYPAAMFRLEELAMLEEAVRRMRAYLQDPPCGGGSSSSVSLALGESLEVRLAATRPC